MRKAILTAGLTVLMAGFSWAQIVPKGNVFIGYSYMHQGTNSVGPANLNGWNGSLEGKIFPFVGLVVDVSGHYGSLGPLPCPGGPCPSSNYKLYNALLGPRVSFSVHGVRPFAEALFGVTHESQNAGGVSSNDTSFATALGGGADFRLAPLIAWRVQADAVRNKLFGASQVNARISTGLVIRF